MLVALVVAAPASAHGGGGIVIHYDNASAKLKGTHGYKVQILGIQDGVSVAAFKGQRTLLKTGKGSNGTVSSQYLADGTSGPKVMKTDLGDFGKVDLEFHATKTSHPKPPKGCHGQLTLKKGVWKGTFKFKGENGYTKASASRIDGTYESGSATCHPLSSGGNKTYVVLSASTAQPKANGTAFFEASKRKSGGKPVINASISESNGSIDISRSAYMTGESGDFTFNPGYTHAKVKGSGPFSGTGNYDSGDWTGSLKVRFPGETVGLTGSGYMANLGEESFKAPR